MKIRNLITTFGWLLLPAAVQAQEHQHPAAAAPVTVELTLEKAESMALERNPHVLAADQRARAAGSRVLPVLFPSDPMFMIEKSGQSGLLDFSTGNEMWMLQQDLGFPGKGIPKADAAGAEAKGAKAWAREARRATLRQVRRDFWELYERRKAWEVRRDAEKRWATLAQVVKSRELTGQWLSLKTVRMQLEVAQATNMFLTAGKELRASVAALNHVLSLDHSTEYAFPQEPSSPAFTGDLEKLTAQAVARDPRLEAVRQEVVRAKALKDDALMEHLPDFNLRVSGMRDPSGGFSEYGFRFGITVPLFFPAKQMKDLEAAGHEASATGHDLKGMEDETVHMLEDAYADAESAWRILSLFEEGGLKAQVERAWRSAQVAYRNEQMPLADYIESYNIYLDTLARYYQAKADYGKALAELDYRAGVDGSEGGKDGIKN